MEVSILIVSKNRRNDLEFTLNILKKLLDFEIHEVLVFLDGCSDDSILLKNNFKEIAWFVSEKIIGASGARNLLYSHAKGTYLIGLDDDAHPLTVDIIQQVSTIFENKQNLGIIAFQEIKGIFNSDIECLNSIEIKEETYYTNEFIGCGFAIKKEVYELTNGFPTWIDIYGEESCVAIEVLSAGFDILYVSSIKVNHRVNRTERNLNKQHYFRFHKQLKNTTYYYLVYYPNPLIKILKLYFHNFRKYALMNRTYFKLFFKTMFEVLCGAPSILKYRRAIDKKVLKKKRALRGLKF